MYAICEEGSGRFLHWSSGATVSDGNFAVWHGQPTEADETGLYWPEPERTATARPAAPVIPTSGAAPLTIDLAQMAAGFSLTVWNEAGTSLTITDGSEDLTLTDPGAYRIALKQPFPARDLDVDIALT